MFLNLSEKFVTNDENGFIGLGETTTEVNYLSYHIISGGMLVYGFRESISSLKTLSFYSSSSNIPYANLSF